MRMQSLVLGRVLISLVAMICFTGTNLFGQRMDTFEGGSPRLTLVHSDCSAQLTEHGMSLIMPHGGRTSEMFEIACSNGTLAFMAYPIEPCAILDEFQPLLWTRCSSGRIQLGVRVIFPFASHPVTKGRLNTILWGSLYTEPGQWQALQVTKLAQRFREENFALRQKYGSELNLEGAYIDCMVLNAYTGPGRYRVQVDDLDLRGMIPMAAVGEPPPANWRENWRWQYEAPSAELRFWAAPNRPPVWLQHQGESLPWIESLGFTGVLTKKLPSKALLAESKSAHLDIISPPPSYPVEFPPDLLPSLKGWLIGAALDSRQISLAREQAALVATLPSTLRKPLVAEALEDYFVFSRVADEVVVPAQLAASAGTPREKSAWLSAQLDTVKQRGTGWVSINVGVTPTLEQQITMANSILNPGLHASNAADPLGLRHQSTKAIISGAKGLIFRTSRPLELQDSGDAAHIASMRWTNADLKLWGPWIVGGQSVQPPAISNEDWVSAAWNISQSHLVVAQPQVPGSQFCVPATHSTSLTFELALPSVGQQLFRMTMGTLERVSTTPTAVGIQWTIEEPEPIESFLVTSNPLVMKFARDQLSRSELQNAADQLDVANYNFELASHVVQTRYRPAVSRESPESLPPELRVLDAAQRRLDRGWEALRRQQGLLATREMVAASDLIQNLLFESHQAVVGQLSAPQSSPFAVTPAALSLHWQLADACDRGEWVALELPGSRFSNLESLLDAGWSQQRRLEEKVDLRVELLPNSNPASSGLRLAAYPKSISGQLEGGYAGASLRVRSAAASVRKGQLVRISGMAKVIQSRKQPGCGLLVYDNQVGPSLGQLVDGERGESIPIELYRFIVEDGELRILAECRGEVDIVLEQIQVSVISPATNRRAFTTRPMNAAPTESILFPIKPN